ncbi:MAG: 2TM domain-containing protein [Candidatus Aenigmarchaeota archaeon]|nr:2TM domain-containing protein [Candidatus Aenigmarchaeota archaeon]
MIMKDSDIKEMAKKRVEFRDHLLVYVIVNAILIVINMTQVPGFWWSLFPLVFWGIGVFFHYREAYHGTQEMRIEQEYKKLKKGTGKKK